MSTEELLDSEGAAAMATYLLLLPVDEIPVVRQLRSPPLPELQEDGGCRGEEGINWAC